MLNAISDLPLMLFRDLVVAYTVMTVFFRAKEKTAKLGTRIVLQKGLGWCAGLAFIAALGLARPYCIGGDPLFGGDCRSQESVHLSRLAGWTVAFVYWFCVLFVPVVFGAFNDEARSRFKKLSTAEDNL